jgi:S1-C subfamily serine protease
MLQVRRGVARSVARGYPAPPMWAARSLRRWLPVCLTLGLVAGCGGDSEDGSAPAAGSAEDGADGRAALIEKVKPSVVAVQAVPRTETRDTEKGGAHAHGSGVVYDAERGLVLTSNHFVEQAVSLQVDVNGRQVQGRPVARAQCNDLTVIRLRPKPPDLTAIEFADSGKVKSGEDVTALGYLRPPNSPAPEFISTTGSVSVPDVSGEVHPDLPEFESLLLFQAPLRPAMSGGPVINDRGEMVGLSTFIDTGQGGPTTEAPYSAITSGHLEKLLAQLEPTEGAVFSGWQYQHKCHDEMAELTGSSFVHHGGP